ncbi:hypothetical protein H2199_008644 [Coniosporium tulheliwenetii]|uniref:Uncharacterized protein n=1 Tax=Coniosporium tulheliwenetii TaxID=3383036 RepID=A0ACC2YIZ0_9PEZI|nr:hypothetical protein H2199_008644 [Cladosporium sp. JES 115]
MDTITTSTGAKAPVYSREQLEQYFDRIHLPQDRRKYDVSSASPEEALDYLGYVQKYHLSTVPFENLSLHYSQHHKITLHPAELFKKIVLTPGRGGYCMEANRLFSTVLRSLGYQLYTAGARVNDGGSFTGWSHMTSLVTIGDKKYKVDVGFGPNGSTHPLVLNHEKLVSTHIAPASMRLVWKNIEANTDPSQRLWVYQHRINDDCDFQDMYCFTELEFLPNDYNLMNFFTSMSPTTWFTQKIVCAKMILNKDEELSGQVILGDGFKRRVGGKTVEERKFKNEEERLECLKVVFGIRFSESERDGIKGMVSELNAAQSGI